jgi:hypothetical protein
MKPKRTRVSNAVVKAEWALYRSLCEERARIVGRLRALETQQIADYLVPTTPLVAPNQITGRLTRERNGPQRF